MGCCSSKEDKYKDSSDADALKKRIAELEREVVNAKKAASISAVPIQPAPAPAAASKLGAVEVLWFPEPKLPCKFYISGEGCRKHEKGQCTWAHEETNLMKMLRVLKSAKRTLDVAVFTITCDQICDALLEAHKKGIKVRIITDKEQATTLGSDIKRMAEAGIPVRADTTPSQPQALVHHKFAVVDGETVLTGSFNWTRSAVISNFEHIVVVRSNKELSKIFTDGFNKMWAKFAVFVAASA